MAMVIVTIGKAGLVNIAPSLLCPSPCDKWGGVCL
jgi:hypothetical protein